MKCLPIKQTTWFLEKLDESKILLLNQEILDTLDTGIEFREGFAALGALN